MSFESTRSDTTVRVTLPDRQVELLDALAAEDGPYDDRSEAVAAVVAEFEAVSTAEPVVESRQATAGDRSVSR